MVESAPTAAAASPDDLGRDKLQPRKCHEFETDLGDAAVRQAGTRGSNKINMPRGMSPCPPL